MTRNNDEIGTKESAIKKEVWKGTGPLINFLHSGCILVISLEGRHIVVAGDLLGDVGFDIFVETEAELDHAVNATGMDLGILEAEAGSEERGFVEKHAEILDGFVVLVRVGFLAQRLHDRVLRIDFQLQDAETN